MYLFEVFYADCSSKTFFVKAKDSDVAHTKLSAMVGNSMKQTLLGVFEKSKVHDNVWTRVE